VRQFVDAAFNCIGWSIRWKNAHGGLAARGYHDDRVVVAVSQEHRRPAEVPALCGDARKARDVLGWEPTFTFKALVKDMVAADLKEAQCRRATTSFAA
jgi:GDPmannose 4,6-dehydratase